MLALAYKQLDNLMTPSELRHLPRDSAESQLTFAGGRGVGKLLGGRFFEKEVAFGGRAGASCAAGRGRQPASSDLQLRRLRFCC